MSSISDRIKLKRKGLKETQAEFGKRFGISHAAVSDMERGVTEHFPITLLDFVLDLNALPDLSQLQTKKTFKITVEPLEATKRQIR